MGCAVALHLVRRGRRVTLLEADRDVALSASGTNSGILHTGFDSTPGELETALIRRAVPLRDAAIDALGIPVRRCGARMRDAPPEIDANASAVGVQVRRDGPDLLIPGEAVTDPVAMAQAIRGEAVRLGLELRLGAAVTGTLPQFDVVINCAGLRADEVARLFGDDSFAVRPRKGEFLVFADQGVTEILLPRPTKLTKGVLVFPTLDGHTICGPTALDLDDKTDWTVRPQARDELRAKAQEVLGRDPGAPVFAYAGLRPAGRHGENYVIGWSSYSDRLINVAAIRSTGLSAAFGIADHVGSDLLGVDGPPAPYQRASSRPTAWWRRTADYRGVA